MKRVAAALKVAAQVATCLKLSCRRATAIAVGLALWLTASQRSLYLSPELGYDPLIDNVPSASIDDNGMMCDSNEASTSQVRLCTAEVPPKTPFTYYARLACNNNREGNRSRFVALHRGTRDAKGPQWGIVFAHDGKQYWTLTMQCTDSDFDNDITQERSMKLSLVKCVSDEESIVVGDTVVAGGLDLDNGFNFIGVRVGEKDVVVLGGTKGLRELMRVPVGITTKGPTSVGYILGPSAQVTIERTGLTFSTDEAADLATGWTLDMLKEHFADSKDPFEGFWQYLDREMEDKWLRMGGRYTIALVKNRATGDYDIIYVDGAKVHKSQWHTGMRKGKMTPTIFTDNYNATWVDATKETISDDVQATFESGVILKIAFPVYKSQLRFSKVIKTSEHIFE